MERQFPQFTGLEMTSGRLKLEMSVLICNDDHAIAMRVLVAVVLVTIHSLAVTAGDSGVNEFTPINGTEISSISHEGFVSNSEPFSISLTINGSSNVTSVLLITQACINSGVCYSPQTHEMDNEPGSIENDDSGDSLFMKNNIEVSNQFENPDDHVSYLNWKFVLISEDGYETHVPESGFGWKIWSNCWYDNSTWGGNSSHCQDEGAAEDAPTLPYIAAPLALASVAMAALMSRRV